MTTTSWAARVRLALAGPALVVLVINGLSRLLGFVREVYISSLFGVSAATDAFFAVQQLPLMASSFLMGAFGLVFIPHYASWRAAGTAAAAARRLVLVLLAIAGLATVVMFAVADTVLPLLAPASEEARQLVPGVGRVLALSIVPVALVGYGYSLLHAQQRHVAATLLAAATPAFMLAGLALLATQTSFDGWFVLAGSFLVAAWLGASFAVRPIAAALRRGAAATGASVSRALRSFGRALTSSSVENVGFNLNQLLTVYFAAWTGPGGVAANAFALRLAMLPLSAIVTPLNQITQARLSQAAPEDRRYIFVRDFARTFAATAVLAAVLLFARQPIVSLIYERGAFAADATAAVAAALVPYAVYLLVMTANQTLARYAFVVARGGLYARAMIAAYVVANVAKPFAGARYGLPGVLWAAVVCEGVGACVIAWRTLGPARGEAS